MIRLTAGGTQKSISIVPRNISEGDIAMTITEDGTNITETLTTISSLETQNYTIVSFIPTILKDENSYYIELTRGGNLWYRDKIYVTSQANDEVIHTLNTNKYTEYGAGSEDEYIVI